MSNRTKEQRLWDAFKGGVNTATLKLQRIECLYSGEGVPDVLGQNKKGMTFWLECKAIDGWPHRASTYPCKDMYEPGQEAFLRGWWFWGGKAFVLFRSGIDFFLLDPRDNLTVMTRHDIMDHAVVYGKREIIKYLEELTNDED